MHYLQCFANLAGIPDNQWFALLIGFPSEQISVYFLIIACFSNVYGAKLHFFDDKAIRNTHFFDDT